MPKLHITGWRYGLKKVSMTTLLKTELSLGLKEAKDFTDRVLNKEIIVFDIEDLAKAQELAQKLDAIGADVKLHA